MPYALVPIGLSALLVYIFTYILSRSGLLSLKNHRRLWNTLLLLTFFSTAIMGIILAVQVNYKLEMPVVEKLIVWHVDFGIGMSFIAVFHFSWHWAYYMKLFAGKGNAQPVKEETAFGDNISSHRNIPTWDKLPLFSLGATALITQVILLREYLAIFHCNELVIGVILAGWLLLTGTGALMGKNISPDLLNSRFPAVAFYMLGILPILTVFGIRFFKNIVFPVGSMSGIPGILLYSVAGMSVFCILSGFLFTWLSSWISIKHRSNLLNLSYAIESAGSIAAGLLFSFLLVHVLNTFQILFILLLLNLGTGFACRAAGQRRNLLVLSGFTALLCGLLVFGLDLDLRSRSLLFRNQDVVETRDTPYGNLVVSHTGEQYNLFENSSPLSVSEDIASVEEDVHYAMVQHPNPLNVLALSGDLTGMTNELGKYHLRQVDFVELNPWITKMRNRYMSSPEVQWLRVVHMDGRKFLAGTQQKYDVVLVNLPPPGSARINRFYTTEFFSLVKSHMGPSGILSIPLEGMENYLSMEAGSLYSILYHTLKLHYDNVLVIPGHKTYFLASDGELDLDIPALIDSRGIETVYVNSFYLDRNSLQERNIQVMNGIPDTGAINRDFRPRAFLYQIRFWLSYFRSNLWITLGIFLILIFLIGFRAGPLDNGIFITGFTGMGIELAILLGIQVIFGYVYLYTSVVLTVFMSGLAAGSLSVKNVLPTVRPKNFAVLQVLLAGCVFLVLCWFKLIEARSMPRPLLHAVFLMLTFLTSFISGLLFGTAALLRKTGIAKTAGGLYSADLAGSAAGALGMAVLMIPILGLTASLFVLLLVNLLSFLNSLFRKSAL